MKMNMGSMYRAGVRVKEFGERASHVKILGLRPFGPFGGIAARIGLALRGAAAKRCLKGL